MVLCRPEGTLRKLDTWVGIFPLSSCSLIMCSLSFQSSVFFSNRSTSCSFATRITFGRFLRGGRGLGIGRHYTERIDLALIPRGPCPLLKGEVIRIKTLRTLPYLRILSLPLGLCSLICHHNVRNHSPPSRSASTATPWSRGPAPGSENAKGLFPPDREPRDWTTSAPF